MATDEFLQDFIDEAKMHIEKVEQAFLDTQTLLHSDEKINEVFRAIHSIKGTAGFFQLKTIVAFSHALENVLGQVRSHALELDDALLDVLLSCNDLLKQMVFDVGHSEQMDISAHLKMLEDAAAHRAQPAAPPAVEVAEALPPAVQPSAGSATADTKGRQPKGKAPVLHVYNKQVSLVETAASAQIDERFYEVLEKLVKHGHNIYKLAFSYSDRLPIYFGRIQKLFDLLQETGELLDIFTDEDTPHDPREIAKRLDNWNGGEPVRVELLTTSVLEPGLFYEAVGLPMECFLHIKSENFLRRAQKAEKQQEEQQESALKAEETVRVNVKLLESLIALSGEMVHARNQLLTAYDVKNSDPAAFGRVLKHVDSLTSQLQEQMMLTRMQPVGNVFNKFPRVIREISKSIHKDIALYLEGKEIQLDKTMIEGLADPLTHLVRNAADHGLEEAAVREANGKPARGTINLRAYHKGGMVAIEVSDDGGGIDIEAVKRKAVEQGLATEKSAAQMKDSEAYRLIMLAGFSTAKSVSDLSGRGVGMDVVRSNVEKMGGTMEIDSRRGNGTTITLLLPRTLAIMKSLVVESCGQRFAIPQSSIVQVISLNKDDEKKKLEKIQNAYELRMRGGIWPVIQLSDVLELTPSGAFPTKVVIIKVLKKQLGLLVHEVCNTEETLVKPLPGCLKQATIYSGVTIMGDGRISLILDPDGIVKKSAFAFEDIQTEKPFEESEKQEAMQEYQSMMLFRCSGPELYGIDLNMVSRVETINVSDIERIGSDQYVNIRGKTLRVIHPEQYLPVTDDGYKTEKLMVIIPNLVSHPIGILAEKIIDNTKARFVLDTEQLSAKGIFGTVIHQGRIVILLNLYELFEIVDPVNHKIAQVDVDLCKRVLVVEDTPFFQHVEQKYLENAGCTVTIAENGKEAWELLQKNEYEAMVSDLIMPIMNGLELIKLVRKHPKLSQMPAIAVSSMTSDHYVENALEYGFDAFENKLNKETLIKTIDNVIKSRKGRRKR